MAKGGKSEVKTSNIVKNKELRQLRHMKTMERKTTKSVFARTSTMFPDVCKTKTQFRNIMKRFRHLDDGTFLSQKTSLHRAGLTI